MHCYFGTLKSHLFLIFVNRLVAEFCSPRLTDAFWPRLFVLIFDHNRSRRWLGKCPWVVVDSRLSSGRWNTDGHRSWYNLQQTTHFTAVKERMLEMLLTSAFWKQSNWKVPVRMSSTSTEAACFTLIFTAAAWKCCQAVVCTAQFPTAIETPIKTNLKATPSARGWRCRWSQRHKAGQRKLGTEVIEKDCQTRQLCKEDAMDHVTHCINHGKRSANKGGRSGW